MKYSQKIGGLAALYEAFAHIAGMLYFLIVVDYLSATGPAQKLTLLVDNTLGMQVVTLLSYVVFGVWLVVLTLALHDRVQAGSPALMQTATAFGLIWAALLIGSGMVFNSGLAAVFALQASDSAQATTVWAAIDIVHNGLGGEVEILGGLWMLLASWAALRAGALPRALNFLGVFAGVAGILSIVPALGLLVAVYALGQIAWFIWLGVVMLRSGPAVAAQSTKAGVAAATQPGRIAPVAR